MRFFFVERMLNRYVLLYQGVVVVVVVWKLDLQLLVQPVPTNTNVVSSRPSHSEVYSIQHYVIKFVSELRQVGCFLQVLLYPPRYS